MEAVLIRSSPDKSLSSYKKQIRVSKSNNGGGILQGRPQVSLSSASFLPPNQHLPPLLPLPIPNPDTKPRNRGLLFSSSDRKTSNRMKNKRYSTQKSSYSIVKGNQKRDLRSRGSVNTDDFEKFSGPVAFTLSPPPSSLPLPRFSLQPKLSCNAEPAGVDAGATDYLRRLLRLE